MPSSESLISRLVARARALMPEDWRGEAGLRFRRTTRAISDFAEEHHLTPEEALGEGVELGRRKLTGMANHELSEAVRNFADAERIKIEGELQRRSLEIDLSKKDADARKAGADARLAELHVVAAEIDLLKKLQEAGVILSEDSKGNLTVLPLSKGADLSQLAEQRKLTGKCAPEVFRDPDGVHVRNQCMGPISFPDESVIIEGGALVYGSVSALNVEIRPNAAVSGNVVARESLTLREDARLVGDVTTRKISIDERSYFKGGLNIIKT